MRENEFSVSQSLQSPIISGDISRGMSECEVCYFSVQELNLRRCFHVWYNLSIHKSQYFHTGLTHFNEIWTQTCIQKWLKWQYKGQFDIIVYQIIYFMLHYNNFHAQICLQWGNWQSMVWLGQLMHNFSRLTQHTQMVFINHLVF